MALFDSLFDSIRPAAARRLWVALFGVALLSFAGCAVGAVDCSVFKPLGLAAALAAAAVSFLDTGPDERGPSGPALE